MNTGGVRDLCDAPKSSSARSSEGPESLSVGRGSLFNRPLTSVPMTQGDEPSDGAPAALTKISEYARRRSAPVLHEEPHYSQRRSARAFATHRRTPDRDGR